MYEYLPLFSMVCQGSNILITVENLLQLKQMTKDPTNSQAY